MGLLMWARPDGLKKVKLCAPVAFVSGGSYVVARLVGVWCGWLDVWVRVLQGGGCVCLGGGDCVALLALPFPVAVLCCGAWCSGGSWWLGVGLALKGWPEFPGSLGVAVVCLVWVVISASGVAVRS